MAERWGPEPDYDSWLNKDLWTTGEFVLLACGFEPNLDEGAEQVIHSEDDETQEWVARVFAPCRELSNLLDRSVGAGSIVLTDYPSGLMAATAPITFIRWAMGKGVTLPDPLYRFEAQQPITDSGDHLPDESLSRREARKVHTRAKRQRIWEEFELLQRERPNQSKRYYAKQIRKRLAEKYGIEYKSDETVRRYLSQRK